MGQEKRTDRAAAGTNDSPTHDGQDGMGAPLAANRMAKTRPPQFPGQFDEKLAERLNQHLNEQLQQEVNHRSGFESAGREAARKVRRVS